LRTPAALVLGLALGVALLAAWPPVQADDPKPAAAPTEVELELLKSLHIAVEVQLNDAGPFRMIFDLGSPVMLVSGRAAAEAGLISQESAKKPAFFGMRGEGKVKKYAMGDLVVDDVPVMIMDHPTLKEAAKFLGPIDGIVGYPLFARYKFSIDYPASKMTFTPSDYQPQDVMQQMMGRLFAGASRDKKKLVSPTGLWGITVEKSPDDEEPGVTISHVYATGPADAAGLKPGDRILTIDGRWTDSVADTLHAASLVKTGAASKVLMRRGDAQTQIELQPTMGL
jgi:hypothetical protein